MGCPGPGRGRYGGRQADHVDPDVEGRPGRLGEDHAPERRDVAEVAAPRGDDVARVGEVVVGRVEVDPPAARHHHRRPRVRGVRALQAGLPRRRGGLEVAADVARGQPDRAQAAQRQVGEVLADALPQREQLLEGGPHVGDPRGVREVLEDRVRQPDERLARAGRPGRGPGGRTRARRRRPRRAATAAGTTRARPGPRPPRAPRPPRRPSRRRGRRGRPPASPRRARSSWSPRGRGAGSAPRRTTTGCRSGRCAR